MVRDAFPLPCVDEAPEAVHNCQWFRSFDVVQGYLQMPVEEADIPKTAFWAGSSGLYEFAHMPFRLSNSGSSFCHLMEMCLGDQQFVTLLLHLDDICVFAVSIDEMLDLIELVFKQLEEFNLKIKPKKCHFFQYSIVFLGHVLSAEGISANPKKVEKVTNWLVNQPKRVTIIFGVALLLPPLYTKIWCNNYMFTPAGRSIKPSKKQENGKNNEPEVEPNKNRQTFQ